MRSITLQKEHQSNVGNWETVGPMQDSEGMKWCFGKMNLLVGCTTELKGRGQRSKDRWKTHKYTVSGTWGHS